MSATSLCITRGNVWDLLFVKPDHRLTILTHGTHELPVKAHHQFLPVGQGGTSEIDNAPTWPSNHNQVMSVVGGTTSTVTLEFNDGWKGVTTMNLLPQDTLTTRCLHILALTLPSELMFSLHQLFLQTWSSRHFTASDGIEFASFTDALYELFNLPIDKSQPTNDPWMQLGRSTSHDRFREDPALKGLRLPANPPRLSARDKSSKPHKLLAAVLYALHTLGEDLRLMTHNYRLLIRLAPLICRIALTIRPEWADYWKRLCPDAVEGWISPQSASMLTFFLVSQYSSSPIQQLNTLTIEYLFGPPTSPPFFMGESATPTGKFPGTIRIIWQSASVLPPLLPMDDLTPFEPCITLQASIDVYQTTLSRKPRREQKMLSI